MFVSTIYIFYTVTKTNRLHRLLYFISIENNDVTVRNSPYTQSDHGLAKFD